jgi:hypothetical protein
MIENWVEIQGTNGLYFVSDKGNVRSAHFGKEKQLTYFINKKGYQNVFLYFNGKRLCTRIHRLVAMSFIPNVQNKDQVNHKNGIKTDNSVENLEWVNNSENVKHAFDTGLKKPNIVHGSRHGMSKLNESQVLEIRQMNQEGQTSTSIAKNFGLSLGTVSGIVLRRNWKHI